MAGAFGLGVAFPGFALGAARSHPTGFVRRRGAGLVLDGKGWRLHGASIYGTSNPGGSSTVENTVALARQAGLNTLRIVDFIDESGDPAVAPYAENDWQRVDRLLAAARDNGLKVILDLSAYRNCLQHWGIANGSSVTPYSQDWSQFIAFVTGRKNTANHLPYRADTTIAIVSFAGEPNPPNSGEPLKPTTEELTNFYARVFAQWRAHDRNHLLSNGGFIHLDWEEMYGNPNGSGIDWRAIFALADNDVPAIHNYPDPIQRDRDFTSPKVGPYCALIGKPWITEEFGISQSHPDSVRADWYQTVYTIQSDYDSAGAAFWNLGPEVKADTFDTNPNTPLTWNVVQSNAP
jgi:endo-1,4-beta-mannosidase